MVESPPLIEPTNFVIFWPGADAPLRAVVEDALGAAVRAPLEALDTLPAPVPDPAAWAAAYRWPGRATPVVIWTEPTRLAGEERRAVGVTGCGWSIGIEMLLDTSEPAEDFERFLRAIACVQPLVPAVLDVNTATYLRRDELDQLLSDPAHDVAHALWVVHAVTDESADETWLHTHGLGRCGRPDVDMLRVPVARAEAAAALLDEVAEWSLDRVVPIAPGGVSALELGPDLEVSARLVGDVVHRLPRAAPGGADDRHDGAHAGMRIVIGDGDDDTSVWPAHTLERITTTPSVRYVSPRASERRRRLARATLDEALTAHAAVASGGRAVQFLVQAGIASSENEVEHLWFEVEEIGAVRVDGRLVHPPMQAPLEVGERHGMGREAISDWRLDVDGASFTPARVAALRSWLEHDAASVRTVDCEE